MGAPDAAGASVPPQRLKWWGALIIGLGSSLFLLLTGLFVLWLWWQRSSVRLANEEVRPPVTPLRCSQARSCCDCVASAHHVCFEGRAHQCRVDF